MWAGPEMVNQETNTDILAPPIARTSEKACQIQTKPFSRVSVCEVSSQTDLTLNDLTMYDTDDMGKNGGRARRRVIVQDVVHDDETCSFYTGKASVK